MKKCRICKQPFEPANSLHVACSMPCAREHARLKTEKKAEKEAKARRKRDRERLEELKPVSRLLSEAQLEFNAYIRERDRDQPCISCGARDAGQWHAGHYRSRGAAPELRFHLNNCHKQCAQCNNFESGNIIEYRKGLVDRISEDRVKWIEGPHEPKKWVREEVIALKREYREKTKQLRKFSGIICGTCWLEHGTPECQGGHE